MNVCLLVFVGTDFKSALSGCYTFPKKDSTYTKKDTLKPTKDFTFVRKKEKKKYFRA
jgi:hypothetical protein